jgi:hypothetical protein
VKFHISVSDNCSKLEDWVNEFLDKHPGIIIHSHQFATCGTPQKNKYVTIFYDESPDFIKLKDINEDINEDKRF